MNIKRDYHTNILRESNYFPQEICTMISYYLPPPFPMYQFDLSNITVIATKSRKDQILIMKKMNDIIYKKSKTITYYILTNCADQNELPEDSTLYVKNIDDIINNILFIIDPFSSMIRPKIEPSTVFMFDNPEKYIEKKWLIPLYKDLIKYNVSVFVITDTISKSIYQPVSCIKIIKNPKDLQTLYEDKLDKSLIKRGGDPNDFYLVEKPTDDFYFIPKDSIG